MKSSLARPKYPPPDCNPTERFPAESPLDRNKSLTSWLRHAVSSPASEATPGRNTLRIVPPPLESLPPWIHSSGWVSRGVDLPRILLWTLWPPYGVCPLTTFETFTISSTFANKGERPVFAALPQSLHTPKCLRAISNTLPNSSTFLHFTNCLLPHTGPEELIGFSFVGGSSHTKPSGIPRLSL